MENETQNQIDQIQKLRPLLPEKKQEDLAQILEYWEEIKAKWEEKKKKFWINNDRDDFMKLLRYNWNHWDGIKMMKNWKLNILDKILGKWSTFWKIYKYLDKMNRLEREKFIEEYLYDYILYSGELEDRNNNPKEYSYKDLKKWNVIIEEWSYLNLRELWIQLWTLFDWIKPIIESLVLKKWVTLNLWYNLMWDEWAKFIAENIELQEWVNLELFWNGIGNEWAKAISKLKLKEGVTLDLSRNNIWDDGINYIVKNMEFKCWVKLNLESNKISEKWAEIISNIELKDGVSLILNDNKFWPEGAKAISKMELKEGVTLELNENQFWPEWAEAISKMELKEGVTLDLGMNDIWDYGAQAIMDNMKLKNNVTLILKDYKNNNGITENMKQKLKDWEKSYHDKWINCKVLF